MGLGLMNDTPFYMSSLKNDSDFVYAKHFHFIYAHLESAADLTFSLGKEAALVQKIMIAHSFIVMIINIKNHLKASHTL